MNKLPKDAVILPQESTLRNVRITKVTDDKFSGMHPNKINVGYEKEGLMFQAPTVGQSCCVGSLTTSVVIEVIDDNTFKTMNSTYRIEYL
jgi:hypothetical protein